MQLSLSFSTLLASVLVLLSSDASVEAVPIKRNAGVVSMPLKRVQERSGVHPQVMYQQHVNRATRRLARMTGREEPSAEELESKLVRRILMAGGIDIESRFNRHGVRFNRAGAKGLSFRDLEGVSGLDDILRKRVSGVSNASDPDADKEPADEEEAPVDDEEAPADEEEPADGEETPDSSEDDGTPELPSEAENGPPVGSGSAGGNGTAVVGSVSIANKPTAANSIGLDIESKDVGYLATVLIGTPARKFSLLMDSGSADMWVGSEDCVSVGGGCGNHQFLGPLSSSSFEDSGSQFQVTYGTGAVAGTIVRDNLEIAGLKLEGHIFGAANQETEEFSDDSVSFDGLIGLAQSTLSNQNTLTPVEALAKNGLIKEAITSYKISRVADGKNDGEITFGGLNAEKFDATTLQTVENVSKVGFWEAEMPSIEVDGKDTGLTGKTAILDTGTTLIIAPIADAEAIHALIDGSRTDGQGGFTVPCDLKNSVALKFGDKLFAIDPRDMAFAPDGRGGNNCISGISGGEIDGPDVWLVGDVFLKNAYFSHDVTKNTMSLATLV